MSCPELTDHDATFKLMMGTKQSLISDWRVGPATTSLNQLPKIPPWTPIYITLGDKKKILNFNENPYNIQLVRMSGDSVLCSSDMSTWDRGDGDDTKIQWYE